MHSTFDSVMSTETKKVEFYKDFIPEAHIKKAKLHLPEQNYIFTNDDEEAMINDFCIAEENDWPVFDYTLLNTLEHDFKEFNRLYNEVALGDIYYLLAMKQTSSIMKIESKKGKSNPGWA